MEKGYCICWRSLWWFSFCCILKEDCVYNLPNEGLHEQKRVFQEFPRNHQISWFYYSPQRDGLSHPQWRRSRFRPLSWFLMQFRAAPLEVTISRFTAIKRNAVIKSKKVKDGWMDGWMDGWTLVGSVQIMSYTSCYHFLLHHFIPSFFFFFTHF